MKKTSTSKKSVKKKASAKLGVVVADSSKAVVAKKPSRSGYQAERVANRAPGMCGSCLNRPVVENRSKCETCLESQRKSRANRLANKPEGFCSSCLRKPAEPGRNKCARCSQYRADEVKVLARAAEQRAKRLAVGMCSHCGKRPFRPNRVTCQPCMDYAVERRAQLYTDRVQSGLCGLCGAPARPDRATCQSCADTTKEASTEMYQRRIADGLCYRCGAPARDDPRTPGRKLNSCSTCAELAQEYLQTKAKAIA